MSAEFLASVLVRWLALASLASLIGALATDRLILATEGTGAGIVLAHRLDRWIRLSIAVLILATLAELLLRTRTLTGSGVVASLSAVPTVLARTHFGAIWIARLVALALALALSFLFTPTVRKLMLLLALGLAATTTLTGHPADAGDLSLAVLLDWVHLTTAAAWTGGLFALVCVILTPLCSASPELLASTARRFSRLATTCLILVVATGAYNAWRQVGAISPLWTTLYGRALLTKLVTVLALVGVGAVNRWAMLPRLDPGSRSHGFGHRLFRLGRLVLHGPRRTGTRGLRSAFIRYVGGEAILAVLVFAATAVMGESTPARHARHEHHRAEAENGPFRVTMEELHGHGGVPPGWRFRPAAGDSARGREVFARLECYTCHRISGAAFPAPTGSGPELTGMGGHHPAGYLAESVMNPNAVIVQGPGYTGADGRSIMPEYGDSLTIRDLNDLVAYLKSLDGGDERR